MKNINRILSILTMVLALSSCQSPSNQRVIAAVENTQTAAAVFQNQVETAYASTAISNGVILPTVTTVKTLTPGEIVSIAITIYISQTEFYVLRGYGDGHWTLEDVNFSVVPYTTGQLNCPNFSFDTVNLALQVPSIAHVTVNPENAVSVSNCP